MGVSTLTLALALCCSARADASPSDAEGSGSPTVQASGQAQIAATTLRLEKAFSDQFVKGQIDPEALAPLVDDVVQAMPEAVRPTVEAHIAQVLEAGQRLALQMTPEQRVQVAVPPARNEAGDVPIAVVNPLGIPIGQDAFGWGGLGGFGYPGVGVGYPGVGVGYPGVGVGYPGVAGNCIPYNTGYAYPYQGLGWNGYTSGYSAGNYSSLSCVGGFGYGPSLGQLVNPGF
jgi:hypothetical protein